MNRSFILLLVWSVALAARAEFFDPVRSQAVRSLPATLSAGDRVIANPSWPDFYQAGWRKIIKVPRTGSLAEAARSFNIVTGYEPFTNTTGEIFLREIATTKLRPLFQKQDEALDVAWPLLASHPATNDIPPYGMTYRLSGYPVTWWVVRQGDLEATQISAHDDQGRPIYRSRNLGTGIERTIHVGALEVAARAAVSPLLEEVSESDFAAMVDLYPHWSVGLSIRAGAIYQYASQLYRTLQAHTTQTDWAPPTAPALFARIAPPGAIAAWVQPAGGHDAYQIGNQVTHNGLVWESTVNANVWQPGVYGWVQR